MSTQQRIDVNSGVNWTPTTCLVDATGAPYTAGSPAGGSTAALQTTGNTSLASIDGKIPATGPAAKAASLPVTLATDQPAISVAVSSSVAATGPTTGTQTSVASSATDVTILASNAARKGALIYNDSIAILYLLMASGTSSTTNYSIQLGAGGSIIISPGEYSGILKGLWASANGFARVTEFA